MEAEVFFHALKENHVEALLIKGVADLGDFSGLEGKSPAERSAMKEEA